MSHEINLFWGGHVVHHQSEDYNLSVALRQSSLQVVWTFAFNLPIALLGFKTVDFALISALNTLYQFWIHTETIGKMGWFEYVFNTPSHHRVHHGRDPKYIDKNHAGSLIIWDKMFGTFQPEEEKPTYGITKPINSWNAVFANVSHYVEMGKDLKRIPSWTDKIKYLFKKPGWLPKSLGGYRPAPEVDKLSYKKYDTPAPMSLNLYVLFQYILCLIGTAIFLNKADQFSLGEKFFVTALICIVVVNSGVLFEQRTWAKYSEWIRIIVYPLLLGRTYLYECLVQLVVHFSGRLLHHFDHLVLRYPKKECLHSNGISYGIVSLLFLFSCGKSLPSFEGIDLQAWKDDKQACQGTRSSMMKAMEGQSKKLLALSRTGSDCPAG